MKRSGGWRAETYEARFFAGEEPGFFDGGALSLCISRLFFFNRQVMIEIAEEGCTGRQRNTGSQADQQ